MARRRAFSARVSAHHHNGTPGADELFTDVQTVTVKLPDLPWLKDIDVDLPSKGVDHVTIRVRMDNPHDPETWTEVRLRVNRDGTINLDT